VGIRRARATPETAQRALASVMRRLRPTLAGVNKPIARYETKNRRYDPETDGRYGPWLTAELAGGWELVSGSANGATEHVFQRPAMR